MLWVLYLILQLSWLSNTYRFTNFKQQRMFQYVSEKQKYLEFSKVLTNVTFFSFLCSSCIFSILQILLINAQFFFFFFSSRYLCYCLNTSRGYVVSHAWDFNLDTPKHFEYIFCFITLMLRTFSKQFTTDSLLYSVFGITNEKKENKFISLFNKKIKYVSNISQKRYISIIWLIFSNSIYQDTLEYIKNNFILSMQGAGQVNIWDTLKISLFKNQFFTFNYFVCCTINHLFILEA